MLNIKRFVFYYFQENTYVINDDTKECIIIDPGCERPAEREELLSYIKDNELIPKAILLTHAHLDHIYGVAQMMKAYNIPALVNPAERFSQDANDLFLQAGISIPEAFEWTEITDGQTFSFGNSCARAIFTPGHSAGGTCWWFEADGCIFTGDTLFKGCVGRTDLFGSSLEALQHSLRDTLMALDGEIDVFPGHGPATCIGYERQTNPFIYDDYDREELIDSALENIRDGRE